MTSRTRHPARPLLIAFLGSSMLLLTHCGGARPAAPTAAGSAGTASLPSCPAVKSDPPPPVLQCVVTAPGTAPTLDDFDDGNLFLRRDEQRVGSWYSFTDESTGCAKLSVEKGDSSPALHFSGGGFSKWGAGFGVSLAWSMAQSGMCSYDLSAYSGVRFRARGNTTLRMNIPTRKSAFRSAGGECPDSEGCFDQQGRNINLTADFRDVELSFCSLSQRGFGPPLGPLDSTQTTNLNFLVQNTNRFDVWLDDIEFIPWKDGQTRDCHVVCPADELALGIIPRPAETRIAQTTGIRLFTFEQPTKDCGSITRRYLSYIPQSLAAASDAPVVIVLHGLGADAESMRNFITQGRFETLADRDGFVVVYGNAAPGPATVAERPNGGGFRKDTSGQIDDFAYLKQIIDDLSTRGLISGKNPIFLSGLSDGGGMTHLAALHDPTRYRGIAELMPYPGPTVPMPAANAGFTLERVLLGYSLTDPGMAPGYATLLAPLGPAWATALGLSPEPRTSALPDVVKEGANYQGTIANALNTRDSQIEQLDYGSDANAAQLRVMRIDHGGHLWPTVNPLEPDSVLAEFGFRNQDVDMSDVVWEFFRSSL